MLKRFFVVVLLLLYGGVARGGTGAQRYCTPAERDRGCSWADQFESEAIVERNGGSVVGAPTFSPNGVVLDGTSDYLTYNLTGSEFDSDEISISVKFTPDFVLNDSADHMIFDAGSFGLTLYKNSSNGLTVRPVNFAFVISYATISPLWVEQGSNVIVLTMISGVNKVFLNGNLVATNGTVWTNPVYTSIHLGSKFDASDKFDGTIHKFQVYKTKLTDKEATDICAGIVYTYTNQLSIDLMMDMGTYDPSNVRALDISGNGAHATFGDGSTPTTYPTKLTNHGYSFDGGDYLKGTATGIFNSDEITIAMEFTPDFETGLNANKYLLDTTVGSRNLIYKADNASANMIILYLSNTGIPGIPEATYSPWWRVNQKNILVVSSDSVSNLTNAWLNEGHVLVDATTAWTPKDSANYWIGCANSLGAKFTSNISKFQVYSEALTPTQVLDLTHRIHSVTRSMP